MTGHKRRHRPALIVLVAVASVVCLGLAWWQWDRYQAVGGTGQNLGYALQWPAFAIAFVYAYRRFVILESDPDEAEKLRTRNHEITELPESLLPDRPAPTAPADNEYNDYLRELAASDAARTQRRPREQSPATGALQGQENP